MKMKFYVLITKLLYSNSENFWKCSVCVRFDFASCLSSEEDTSHRHSKRQQ